MCYLIYSIICHLNTRKFFGLAKIKRRLKRQTHDERTRSGERERFPERYKECSVLSEARETSQTLRLAAIDNRTLKGFNIALMC